MCFDSLSISATQLMSWSAEQPSKSLSSSVEAEMVVEMVKVRRRKQRDIIAVFILLISGMKSSLF